jgi:hypothetical protein
MGTTAGNKTLEIDYPLAFGNAFSKTLPAQDKKFRYIHLSGAATERDQERSLWFKGDMRKMKVTPRIFSWPSIILRNLQGQAEENMLAFAKKDELKGLWKTLIVKAGFVIQKDMKSPRDFMGWMMGSKACIKVDELAAIMIDAALNGFKESTLSDNKVMVTMGREVLESMK